jgi:hypothetical protein
MAFCGKCGASVSGDPFCSKCGNPVGNQATSSGQGPAATGTAPAIEKTFYHDQTVLITNSRCIVAGQTYAMSGITSVRPFTEEPPKGWPVLVVIIGLMWALVSLANLPNALGGLVFALAMIGLGVMWFKSKKDIYHVVVHSASGESRLIHSLDQDYISKIIVALNEAIIFRN